jgi:hypothetical protein
MNKILKSGALFISLAAVGITIPLTDLQAEEVDFSCMSYLVREKVQVSKKYKEVDIVLQNRCPGAVYWSMCIEQISPLTDIIEEELTFSGFLEKEKKTRVNLQMKKLTDESRSPPVFEELYLNVGYAIQSAAKASCVARECEAKKSKLKTQFRKNDDSWQAAKKALSARIAKECPQSGWGKQAQETCEAEIRSSSQADMDSFAQKEKELKQQLMGVAPELCRVYPLARD